MIVKKTKYLKIIGISFAIGIGLFILQRSIGSALFSLVWNSQDASDEWFRDLIISQSDLPAGWIPTNLEHRDEPDAVSSIFVRYETNLDNKPAVQVVIQDLSLYENTEIAMQAYQNKVASYKNRTLMSLEEQEWQADQIYFSCSAGETWRVCDIVAQYGNVVSVVWGHVFVDRSLTYDEFVTVARQVDNRIHQYTEADN
jgi:hypothetical protein